MRHAVWIGVALIAAVALAPGRAPVAAAPPACALPAQPLRYPDIAPMLERECAKCHDVRRAKNDAAQAVFEMSSYPFATKRPATLLDDLRAMLPKRGAFTADEKCRGLAWLTTGALDADGKPPRWR
jgi:hypothetical protein